MSKSIAKSRKRWYEDEYEEFDRKFVMKNKKKPEISEIKRTKNRTFTKMKHISNDEVMQFYDREEESF